MKKLFTLISLLGSVLGMGGVLNAQEASDDTQNKLDTIILYGKFEQLDEAQTVKFKFSATPSEKFIVNWHGRKIDTLLVETTDEIEAAYIFSGDQTQAVTFSIALFALAPTGHIRSLDIDSASACNSVILESCPELVGVNLSHSHITKIDIRVCPALQTLDCSHTPIKYLFLSELPAFSALQTLDCSNTQLKQLFLSGFPALQTLDCSENPHLEELRIECLNLETIHMNGDTAIKEFILQNNTVKETLDLSNLPALTSITCTNCPKMKSIDCSHTLIDYLSLSELPALQTLDCSHTLINHLPSTLSALQTLDCSHTLINYLSLSGVPALQTLNCSNTKLTYLFMSDCPALQSLDCSNNPLERLLMSGLPALQTLDCSHTLINYLSLSELPALQTLDCSENPHLEELRIECLNLETIHMNGDTAIKEFILQNNTVKETLDLSNLPALTSITCTNCPKMKSIDCSHTLIDYLSLSELPALQTLDCSHTLINHLPSTLSALQTLDCSHTLINYLSLSGVPALQTLNCSNTKLTYLFMSDCPALQSLDCSNNPLERLLVSGLPALQTLDCSNNPVLHTLSCEHNQLVSLNLSNTPALYSLNCSHNQLSFLDISDCNNLNDLTCSSNHLSSINYPKDSLVGALVCDSNHIPLSVLAKLMKQSRGREILSPQLITAGIRQVGDTLDLHDEINCDSNITIDRLSVLSPDGSNVGEQFFSISHAGKWGVFSFRKPGDYRIQLCYNGLTNHDGSQSYGGVIYYDLTVVDSVARPVFSVPSGAVWPGTTVSLGSSTPNALIYYTTDGSEPDETALAYAAPIRITEAVTIKAIAIQDTFKSHIATATYTMDTVARPTFSIPSGTVKIGTTVSLSTTTPDASIIYTTDGSEPDNNALEYTEPIRITEAMTVKAVAIYKTLKSQIASVTYTVDSVANENDLSVSKLHVYVKDRIIYLSVTVGKVEVFTMDGHCVYRGFDTAIPVKRSGLYVVSVGDRRWKVVVL